MADISKKGVIMIRGGPGGYYYVVRPDDGRMLVSDNFYKYRSCLAAAESSAADKGFGVVTQCPIPKRYMAKIQKPKKR